MTTEVMTAGVSSAGLVVRALDRTAADPRIAAPARPGEDQGPAGGRPSSPGTTLCRCGHAAEAHEHFRPGSDCGACGATHCRRFRSQGSWRWSRLRRRA